jgi:hypothetical protein
VRTLRFLIALVVLTAMVMMGRPTYYRENRLGGGVRFGYFARYPGFDIDFYRISRSFGEQGWHFSILEGNLPR